MKFFKSNKDKSGINRPLSRRNPDAVKQIAACFAIGSRARYYVDHDEETRLESLIIGYGINDHFVFHRNDLRWGGAENDTLEITQDGRSHHIHHITHFALLVPSDIGEERKLDYQTRVSLGRRGPFAVGKIITLTSLNPARENLRLNAVVRRNLVLKEGIHSGHTMAVLEVDFASVESFESRVYTRVEINVAATVQIDGKDRSYAAYVLDISEKALRLVLDPPDTSSAAFKPRSILIVKMVVAPDRLPITLKGAIFQQRQRQHIVRIEKILRQGEFVDFELIDAMELKILLQDASRRHQQLN